jgi:hypothetical protein
MKITRTWYFPIVSVLTDNHPPHLTQYVVSCLEKFPTYALTGRFRELRSGSSKSSISSRATVRIASVTGEITNFEVNNLLCCVPVSSLDHGVLKYDFKTVIRRDHRLNPLSCVRS